MFDRYLINEKSVRNVSKDGKVIGFAFEAKLGYYRGLGLSMVEELRVTLDGNEVDPKNVIFINKGKEFSLTDMQTAYDERWEFGKEATITVLTPSGLSHGVHELGLMESLRISYLPFNNVAQDQKRVSIE